MLKRDPKKKPKFHKNLRIQISEISAYPKNLALFIGFALHGYVTLTLVVHDLFLALRSSSSILKRSRFNSG